MFLVLYGAMMSSVSSTYFSASLINLVKFSLLSSRLSKFLYGCLSDISLTNAAWLLDSLCCLYLDLLPLVTDREGFDVDLLNTFSGDLYWFYMIHSSQFKFILTNQVKWRLDNQHQQAIIPSILLPYLRPLVAYVAKKRYTSVPNWLRIVIINNAQAIEAVPSRWWMVYQKS